MSISRREFLSGIAAGAAGTMLSRLGYAQNKKSNGLTATGDPRMAGPEAARILH